MNIGSQLVLWWLTFHHTTVNNTVQGFVEQNPILQREARRRRGGQFGSGISEKISHTGSSGISS